MLPDSAAAFQAAIDYNREQIRRAFDPTLGPHFRGAALSPQELYLRRLTDLGYFDGPFGRRRGVI